MPATFINLTPHDVVIRHHGNEPWTCPRADGKTPRAPERPTEPEVSRYSVAPGDDTQGAYETTCSLRASGLVSEVSIADVESLPAFDGSNPHGGHDRFYIVSVTTVLGAIAAGRPIVDLVIPVGQTRDDAGRVDGATGLVPAPLYLQRVIAAIDRTAP